MTRAEPVERPEVAPTPQVHPDIVLLGDSIFDSKAYVGAGPDVVQQLRADLPSGWAASLRTVDGAVTASVRAQLGRIPPEATHLALSIGGNDALRESGIFERRIGSMAEAVSAGHGLPVFDLRLVCDDPADDANPIEPSVRSGEKMAAGIVSCMLDHDVRRGRRRSSGEDGRLAFRNKLDVLELLIGLGGRGVRRTFPLAY